MTRTKSHISLHRYRTATSASSSRLSQEITTPISPAYVSPVPLSNDELKKTMRRLSKMVLAGYGGATLLFFGVSPTAFDTHLKKKNKPPAGSSTLADAMDREKKVEEEQLAEAVDAAEAEAAGDGKLPELPLRKEEYSWWDVLLGKHDQEIFERSLAHAEDSPLTAEEAKRKANTQNIKATAVSLLKPLQSH
jgi:sn1-specific diacylglycerol lipase